MSGDPDLQARMAQSFIDSTRIVVEIANLVGVDGIVHGPDVIAAVRAMIAEQEQLRDDLEAERHQVSVESAEADRIEETMRATIQKLQRIVELARTATRDLAAAQSRGRIMGVPSSVRQLREAIAALEQSNQ